MQEISINESYSIDDIGKQLVCKRFCLVTAWDLPLSVGTSNATNSTSGNSVLSNVAETDEQTNNGTVQTEDRSESDRAVKRRLSATEFF